MYFQFKKVQFKKRFKGFIGFLILTILLTSTITQFQVSATTSPTSIDFSNLPSLPVNYLSKETRMIPLPPEAINVYNYAEFAENIIQFSQVAAATGGAAVIGTTTASLAGPAIALAGMAVFGGYLVWHATQTVLDMPTDVAGIMQQVPDGLAFADSTSTKLSVDELGNLRMNIYETARSSNYQYYQQIMANPEVAEPILTNHDVIYEVVDLSRMPWWEGTDYARVFRHWEKLYVDIPDVSILPGTWNTTKPYYESIITIKSSDPINNPLYFSRYGIYDQTSLTNNFFYQNQVTIGGLIHGLITDDLQPIRIYQWGNNANPNHVFFDSFATGGTGKLVDKSCKLADFSHITGCVQINTHIDQSFFQQKEIYLSDLLNQLGIHVWTESAFMNYMLLNDVYGQNQKYKHELTVDREVIEALNPDVEFNEEHSTYVYKGTNQSVNPSTLQVPVADQYDYSTGKPSYSQTLTDTIINNPESIVTQKPTPIVESDKMNQSPVISPMPTPIIPPTEVIPPVETPPTDEIPPVETPPVETPPVETPPTDEIPPVVDTEQNLFQQLLDWLSQFPAWLVGLLQPFLEMLTNIYNWISTQLANFMDSVLGFFEMIADYFQSLMELLVNFYHSVVEFFTNLPQMIAEWFQNFLNALNNILDSILNVGEWLKEFFLSFFTPNFDLIQQKLMDLQEKFNKKIPIFAQLKNFFNLLFFPDVSSPPDIRINIPEMYGGGSYSVINFSYFSEYRSLILNITRLLIWFPFLKRLFSKLPNYINNGG